MIHNISIATVYNVIILSDDVSIDSVDLFKEIVTLNTVSVGKKNAIISGYDFFHLFIFRFGNSFMATECATTVVSGVVARPVMLRTMHPRTHSKYFFHYCDLAEATLNFNPLGKNGFAHAMTSFFRIFQYM